MNQSASKTNSALELIDTVEAGLVGPLIEEVSVPSLRQVSPLLIPGRLYTREHLKKILNTNDATINTGVFQPTGFASVLLFITKNKTSDRTQYVDQLNEDTLYWQGQTRGTKDPLIVEHVQRGLELLVFYRDRKYEHDGAAFRYEGCFIHIARSGREPADFILHREAPYLLAAEEQLSLATTFDPSNDEDGRRRIFAALVRRQGQPRFRRELLAAYEGRCAITGSHVTAVLEAAHIMPYLGDHTNHVTNGLLLRADLHTLFDLGLIAVDDNMKLIVAVGLHATEYAQMHGQSLLMPTQKIQHPNSEALHRHRIRAGLHFPL